MAYRDSEYKYPGNRGPEGPEGRGTGYGERGRSVRDGYDGYGVYGGSRGGDEENGGPWKGYGGYGESWEDEEDYEEYARARDRAAEAGRAKARGRGKGARTASSRTADAPDAAREARRGSGGSVGRRAAAGQSGGRKSASGGARRKKRRGILGILLRLVIIVLLVGVIAAGVLFYKVRDVLEMQRVDSVDLEEQLLPGISSKVKNDELMNGYRNIALFGVDSREGDLLEGDNRSDSIMICSINEKTGEIRLVSVYRDTMLEVGDGLYSKANAAYAIGGPAGAVTMLNRNLDLNILDFVTVGFEGLAHTIDALGGIELEIDEEERGYLNQYVHDMHVELGTDETPVEATGLVTMTGIQATAYSRIRYTAGDDFRRAERQRTVLQKTLEKAKGASPATLVEVANSVVGDMATSLSSREIVGLILKAQSLELAGTGGFPQEEYRDFGYTWEDGDYVLPVTLADNVRWLHEFLFGEQDYQVSEEAAARSEYISLYY